MLSHFDIIAMKEITLRILDMECAACVSRLDRALLRLPGVKKAAASYASSSAFISFDENALSLSDIAACVKKACFRVPVEEADIRFEGDPVHALKALAEVFGVKDVFVHEGLMTVFMWPVGLDTRKLTEVCADCGLTAEITEMRGGDEDQELEKRMELLKTLVASAACTAPLMLEVHPKLQFLIGSALQFISGRHFCRSALRELRSGFFGMDLLVSLSSALIYGYSSYVALTRKSNFKLYFTSGGVLLSLILFGKYMEQAATGEASSAIRKLMRLQPRTAMVKRGDKFEETSVDKIRLGDIVLIRPGERIPADGVIVGGRCAVDESMLTGESLPVDKSGKDKLIGGSLNRAGSAEVRVTALGKATVLEQIIDIVRRAQSEKAPVQRFADSVAHWFVPAVIGAAAATFAIWYRRIAPKDLEKAVLTCCDVLSVACPCALGLATPTGLMVGSGAAAERGILFRSGTELENAYKTDCIVLDKTGTLTSGQPELTDIHPLPGITGQELVLLCAELEKHSEHPLSRAVIKYASEHYPDAGALEVKDFSYDIGSGVSGTAGGSRIICASRTALVRKGISTDALAELPDVRRDAKAEICVCRDGVLIGVLGIADTLKPEAAEAVRQLKGAGKEVWMLTGDNERTAKSIAAVAGIDNVLFEVRPGEKAAQIERLKAMGKTVCMVGDGINDTPALASADCAVAMGTGSDIAIEAAGVLLPSGDLRKLPEAFDISAATIKTIRQNLRWALFYNIISIPVAAMGILHPSICAAAMSASSIGVLMHSLRLKDPGKKRTAKWKKK